MSFPQPVSAVPKDAELLRGRVNDPVEVKPWRILIVPPTTGAATGMLGLARWQSRLLVTALVVLAVIVAGVTTMAIADMNNADLFVPSADLAATRGRLLAVEDSVSKVRAARAYVDDILYGPSASRELTADGGRRILYGIGAPSMAGLSVAGLPVSGTITSDFSNARRHPLLHIIRPHIGVDITAPPGSRISAPAAGRVTFVGWKLSLGLLIEIEHPNGIVTRYGHCRVALVRAGDRVTRGMMIATVGSSGLTTGPHLHYEVWNRGNPVDPLHFRFPQPLDSAAVSSARGAFPIPVTAAPED
jgi:murein DD-endopeptidase MepM/ murein hydrolase activator NlpD